MRMAGFERQRDAGIGTPLAARGPTSLANSGHYERIPPSRDPGIMKGALVPIVEVSPVHGKSPQLLPRAARAAGCAGRDHPNQLPDADAAASHAPGPWWRPLERDGDQR